MSESDVAVLHGNYLRRGGGEHVADAIAATFDAPLYYGFGDEDVLPDDDVDRRKLFDPGRIASALGSRIYQVRDLLYMWYGQHLPELHEYDTIIHSGNEFGWYVPRDHQVVLKYVHSPPRGPYDMFHRNGDSAMHRGYSLAAKTLYRHTTTYPDLYLANSGVVERRCLKYWGVPARVVYPPVDVKSYGSEHADEDRERTYLTFSRLFRHKRTREIVQAFRQLDGAQLMVGGDGPQRDHLESIAPENVHILGYLSEAEKRRYLAECDACIFNARNEDFGIVPIEAFASGTPVIGVADGFTQHQIADGCNGILFDGSGDPDAVARAVKRFEREGVTATTEQILAYAERFSLERFERELRSAVDDARAKCSIESVADAVDWGDGEGVDVVEGVVGDG